MLIPATILSVIFASLGFLVTKNNARYILSGYNMMPEQQRSLVDIDGYLRFFKQFPQITMKSNGFAAGDFSKGYFRTMDRKTVKLFVNKKEKQILLLNTKEGDIYFSSGEERPGDLLIRIEKWLLQ